MTDQIFDRIEANEIHSAGSLVLSAVADTTIKTDSKRVVKLAGRVTDGTEGEAPMYDIHTTRGTVDAPEVLEPGDFGSSLRFTTFLDEGQGDIGKSLALFITQMDPSADKTDVAPASNMIVFVSAGDGQGSQGSLSDDNYHTFTFSKTGSFNTQAVKLETANVSNVAPVAGTMVYNKETDKFQGYVNDAGNGEPGWINLH